MKLTFDLIHSAFIGDFGVIGTMVLVNFIEDLLDIDLIYFCVNCEIKLFLLRVGQVFMPALYKEVQDVEEHIVLEKYWVWVLFIVVVEVLCNGFHILFFNDFFGNCDSFPLSFGLNSHGTEHFICFDEFVVLNNVQVSGFFHVTIDGGSDAFESL